MITKRLKPIEFIKLYLSIDHWTNKALGTLFFIIGFILFFIDSFITEVKPLSTVFYYLVFYHSLIFLILRVYK